MRRAAWRASGLLRMGLAFLALAATGSRPAAASDFFSMEACLRENTPESLVRDQRNRGMLLSAKASLVTYFACKAGPGGGVPPCRELEGWNDGGDPLDRNCRELYYEGRFILDSLGGNGDPALCRDYLDSTDGCRYGEFFSRRDYPKICRVLRKALVRRSSPEELCSEAQRLGICRKEPRDFDHCRDGFTHILGDPGVCERIGRGPFIQENGMGSGLLRRTCLDRVALVRASRSRDIEACGDSSFCRALMGGAPCQKEKDDIVRTHCRLRQERGRPRW